MRKEIRLHESSVKLLKLLAFERDISVKKLMENIIQTYIKNDISQRAPRKAA